MHGGLPPASAFPVTGLTLHLSDGSTVELTDPKTITMAQQYNLNFMVDAVNHDCVLAFGYECVPCWMGRVAAVLCCDATAPAECQHIPRLCMHAAALHSIDAVATEQPHGVPVFC